LNGKALHGKREINAECHFYMLSKDKFVSGGDVITVRILKINGDGKVSSIQPLGAH